MTQAELSKILEQFAVCAIHIAMADMDPDKQYDLIASGIDEIAETVMLFVDRPLPSPSMN
jgi:hypothetical protein